MQADRIVVIYDDAQLHELRYAHAVKSEYLRDGLIFSRQTVLVHDYRKGFANAERFYL